MSNKLLIILKLTLDDVLDEVSVRLGDLPISIPRPFAHLLRQHLDQRLNLTTATMLGYTQDHTARTATTAGTTWSRYDPGDHTRLRDRRTGDS
ncbi:hypothetical protein [Amycolatopsis sp. cmx-11-12]|uniref:hypothetical protein n=1 Tax=Amycolatopsis sp. cmx-11-12 TaxID=2785795 RepID=UPI003916D032